MQTQSIRFWKKEFRTFFGWCLPRMKEVLSAGGVRELWLQGEAYRYFRYYRPKRQPQHVWTNSFNRNDLAFYEDDREETTTPFLVVEMKVYAVSSYTKNLTGYPNMHPFKTPARASSRFMFTPRHRCHRSEASILKDYKKLRGQGGCTRLLMLVLNRNGKPNQFGEAIQKVDFGAKGDDIFDRDGFLVRWWEVA